VLCDNALLAGFATEMRPIGPSLIDEVAKDFDLRHVTAAEDLVLRDPPPPGAPGLAAQVAAVPAPLATPPSAAPRHHAQVDAEGPRPPTMRLVDTAPPAPQAEVTYRATILDDVAAPATGQDDSSRASTAAAPAPAVALSPFPPGTGSPTPGEPARDLFSTFGGAQRRWF